MLVATETGMLHQLRQANPAIDFQPVNRAAVCKYMKMITPAKLLRSLREGVDEILIDRDIADRARAVGRADDRHRHPVADGRVAIGGSMSLPDATRRAAAATWTRDVDVVVLGSGAAGLSAALAARPVRSVLVVTKDILSAGSTQWAQGGLAGVLDPSDTLENHVRDTLDAGAGLCDEAVVRELVDRGTEVDPLPDAPRCRVRPRAAPRSSTSSRHRSRSPARAATATTGSSTPAVTSPAPRCNERSTNRRSAPASRC